MMESSGLMGSSECYYPESKERYVFPEHSFLPEDRSFPAYYDYESSDRNWNHYNNYYYYSEECQMTPATFDVYLPPTPPYSNLGAAALSTPSPPDAVDIDEWIGHNKFNSNFSQNIDNQTLLAAPIHNNNTSSPHNANSAATTKSGETRPKGKRVNKRNSGNKHSKKARFDVNTSQVIDQVAHLEPSIKSLIEQKEETLSKNDSLLSDDDKSLEAMAEGSLHRVISLETDEDVGKWWSNLTKTLELMSSKEDENRSKKGRRRITLKLELSHDEAETIFSVSNEVLSNELYYCSHCDQNLSHDESVIGHLASIMQNYLNSRSLWQYSALCFDFELRIDAKKQRIALEPIVKCSRSDCEIDSYEQLIKHHLTEHKSERCPICLLHNVKDVHEHLGNSHWKRVHEIKWQELKSQQETLVCPNSTNPSNSMQNSTILEGTMNNTVLHSSMHSTNISGPNVTLDSTNNTIMPSTNNVSHSIASTTSCLICSSAALAVLCEMCESKFASNAGSVVVFCKMCRQGKYGHADICHDCIHMAKQRRNIDLEHCRRKVARLWESLKEKQQRRRAVAVVSPEPRSNRSKS